MSSEDESFSDSDNSEDESFSDSDNSDTESYTESFDGSESETESETDSDIESNCESGFMSCGSASAMQLEQEIEPIDYDKVIRELREKLSESKTRRVCCIFDLDCFGRLTMTMPLYDSWEARGPTMHHFGLINLWGLTTAEDIHREILNCFRQIDLTADRLFVFTFGYGLPELDPSKRNIVEAIAMLRQYQI